MDGMIYCHTCEEFYYLEDVTRGDIGTGEIRPLCPKCNSDGIEEAVQCLACAEYYIEDTLMYGLCGECQADAKAMLDDAIEGLCKEKGYSHAHHHYLKEAYNDGQFDVTIPPPEAYMAAS